MNYVDSMLESWELDSNIIVLRETFALRVCADTEEERTRWTDHLAGILSSIVGGASVTVGKGYWINDETGEKEAEPSILIEANCVNAVDVFDTTLPEIWKYMVGAHQQALWVRFNDRVAIMPRDALLDLNKKNRIALYY